MKNCFSLSLLLTLRDDKLDQKLRLNGKEVTFTAKKLFDQILPFHRKIFLLKNVFSRN
jgi:hypothetical protein